MLNAKSTYYSQNYASIFGSGLVCTMAQPNSGGQEINHFTGTCTKISSCKGCTSYSCRDGKMEDEGERSREWEGVWTADLGLSQYHLS